MTLASKLIENLALQPHPEGGFYRETFRSEQSLQTTSGLRSAGTTILYLLEGENVSRFHRIDADEIWFFHSGGTLLIHSLEKGGVLQTQKLSADNPQVTISSGIWFGAELAEKDKYCLVGCAVMPGFEFSGFELATREQLLADWPSQADLISRLT